MTDAADNRARLIESIYRIALEPQTFDQFMGQWGSHINDRLDELQALQQESGKWPGRVAEEDPEIARHFEIASQLLEQMAQHVKPGDGLPGGADRRTSPQMLVDAAGRIVWFNGAAHRAFQLNKSSTVESLEMDARHRKALKRLCDKLDSDLSTGALPRPAVLMMQAEGEDRPLHLQARIMPDRTDGNLLIIQKIAPDWPDGIARMLIEDFNLSAAECAICELIAEGNGPEQIAELRGSAVGTVRTQLKKIMAKTGSRGQVELVRLLFSLMRMVEHHPAAAGSGDRGQRVVRVQLADGRTLPAEVHGAPGGTPVVFFHGMLDGINITVEMERHLTASGFRLICPVRPWFGASEPAPGPVETAPERFAADVGALLDHLGTGPVLALGHMAGSLYAFAFAQAMPERVRGILSVSGAIPLVTPQDFAAMSSRQRLVAYTARYAPKLLPFVLRAGISQMMNGGQRRFIRSMYEETPPDLAVVNDPEHFERIAAGHRFSVRQGHRAFETDSHHMVADWSARIDASSVPVRVLHGDADPAVNPDAVRRFFARRADRATVTMLEGSGQLIVYHNPLEVVRQLVALRGQTA